MVTTTDSGLTKFRIYVPDGERVQLLGTFTGWHDQPISMDPVGDGWHEAALEIRAGDHEFQYLIDGRRWLADYAAGGMKRNEFGCWVSQLHVTTRRVAMPRLAA